MVGRLVTGHGPVAGLGAVAGVRGVTGDRPTADEGEHGGNRAVKILALLLIVFFGFSAGYLACGAQWLALTRWRRIAWRLGAVGALVAAASAAINWVL